MKMWTERGRVGTAGWRSLAMTRETRAFRGLTLHGSRGRGSHPTQPLTLPRAQVLFWLFRRAYVTQVSSCRQVEDRLPGDLQLSSPDRFVCSSCLLAALFACMPSFFLVIFVIFSFYTNLHCISCFGSVLRFTLSLQCFFSRRFWCSCELRFVLLLLFCLFLFLLWCHRYSFFLLSASLSSSPLLTVATVLH